MSTQDAWAWGKKAVYPWAVLPVAVNLRAGCRCRRRSGTRVIWRFLHWVREAWKLPLLQVARLTAVAANGGYLVEPRLVHGFKQGREFSPANPSPFSAQAVISPLTAARLRYLMMKVVDRGTGRDAHSEMIILGGKTGTAETGRTNPAGAPLYYYWFSGLLPLEDCRAVVTVSMGKVLFLGKSKWPLPLIERRARRR